MFFLRDPTLKILFRQPPPLYSVLYGIISKGRCILLRNRNCSLEKNQMPRESTLIAISLACLVAQWNTYGGRWKWVIILPILVGIVQLLCAICFCIPLYVHQQLHSLDCQKCIFTYLGTSPGAGIHFWKGDLQFSKLSKNTICVGVCTLKCTEKHLIPFTPIHFLPEFVNQTEFKAKPWICPLEYTVSYVSQKLCVFQPSSPLYSIHPLMSQIIRQQKNLVFC
jgi:hypothetical protein